MERKGITRNYTLTAPSYGSVFIPSNFIDSWLTACCSDLMEIVDLHYLLARMAGASPPNAPAIPTELIVRASTARPAIR
jgi:hypothetical protein